MPRPPVRYRQRHQQASSPARGSRQQLNNNPRQHLARKLADKPVGKRPDDSDDSDRLVTKGAGSRRSLSNSIQEIYASGAVADGDKPGAHPTRAQRKRTLDQAMKSPTLESMSSDTPGLHQRTCRAQQQDQDQEREQPAVSADKPQADAAPMTNGVAHSTQPTPSRDTSVLEGFQPRKRQPSILRATHLDSSTCDLSTDSFALPDDESTPVQLLTHPIDTATPTLSILPNSLLRKRKITPPEPARPASKFSSPALKNQSAATPTPTQEPSLPPQSISALHTSGQKLRQTNLDIDDDDIMAPPMSSSSSTSPVKLPSSKSKSSSRSHIPTTEELQALMPTKRRKVVRHRAKASEFDIPLDSASDPAGEQDDSFLPSRSKGKRRKATATKSTVTSKPKPSKPSVKASTTRVLQNTRSSRRNAPKSPTPASFLGASKVDSSSRTEERSGGSPLKPSVNTTDGKENNVEMLVPRSDDESESIATSTTIQKMANKKSTKTKRSKWDDIDAFEMDFEDVSVHDESDVNAR